MDQKIPDYKLKYKQKFDWVKFIVHFFFGALLGGIFMFFQGTMDEFWVDSNKIYYYLTIACGALLVGLLAGFFGDKFWHFIAKQSIYKK